MTITLDQLTQAVASESLEAACLRQPHFTESAWRQAGCNRSRGRWRRPCRVANGRQGQRLAQARQKRIDQQRDMQRQDRQDAQFIEDQLHSPLVAPTGGIVLANVHRGDDQVAQQGLDIDHTAALRQVGTG
ncbi:hypothetical protein [Azotobacter chroococcum]|uniref:hypothetical protein n=1 Tax=Azotobacter chroococcum TaxID=353 RepID=UPI0013F15E01|nr:hypothetical protein [Azotobacter chroococcum]